MHGHLAPRRLHRQFRFARRRIELLNADRHLLEFRKINVELDRQSEACPPRPASWPPRSQRAWSMTRSRRSSPASLEFASRDPESQWPSCTRRCPCARLSTPRPESPPCRLPPERHLSIAAVLPAIVQSPPVSPWANPAQAPSTPRAQR